MRVEEARRSAEVFLAGTSTSEISIYGFRDGFLPFQGELVKEAFEDLKANFVPDLILTHHDDDRHQDHRLDLATDLEYLARPHDPRIRDHEI